jgi:hypothetical protein
VIYISVGLSEGKYPDGKEDVESLIVETVVDFCLEVLDCFGFGRCVSLLDVFEYHDKVGGKGSQVQGTGS